MNARKACNSLLLTHLGVGSSLLDIGYWKEVRDPPRTQTHGHKIARRQHLNVIQGLGARKAVDGYHEFEELAKEYARVTLAMTRQSATNDL